MKKALLLLALSASAFSQTIYMKSGDKFIGEETYNHGRTGKACELLIHSVEPNPSKGLHCMKLQVEYFFESKKDKLPQTRGTVFSSTTRRSGNVSTCASLVDPSDDVDTVFSQNDSGLFNPLFTGQDDGGFWSKTDYFVFFESDKMPKEAKLANVRPMIEREWVCKGLELKRP